MPRIGVGVGIGRRRRAGAGAVAPAFSRGWAASYDAGTDGNYFVDNVNGLDANSGSFASPKASIAAAISAAIAAGGQRTIRIRDRGVPYPAIDLAGWSGTAGAKQKITGYGTEKPHLSGADVVTGWTRCGAPDSSLLGATLGVAGSPVFKATVARTSLSLTITGAELIGIGLVEADALVPLVKKAAANSSEHVTTNPDDMFQTPTYTVDGSNHYTSITLAGVVDLYTPAQLAKAWVAFHGSPNLGMLRPIASASGATINFTSTSVREVGANAKFLLVNILPELTSGHFGFVDNGDSTVTLYLYPTSEANLASGIRVTARSVGITASMSNNVIVEGFEVSHYGGDARLVENGYGAGTVGFQTGNEFRHLFLRETPGGSALYSQASNGTLVDYVSVRDIYERTTEDRIWRAVSFQRFSAPVTGNKIKRLDIRRTAQSPVQFYGQTNAFAGWLYFEDCGLSAHSNLINGYLQTENTLFFGVETVRCKGYATWQNASKVDFAFFLVDHVLADGESIKDQAGTFPTSPTTFTVTNCATRSGISIGAVGTVGVATIYARNNITAKISIQNVATTETLDSHHNVLLDAGLDLGGVGPFNVQFPSTSVFVGSTMKASPTSPVIGLGGADMEAWLLAWEALLGENLHFDVNAIAFPKLDFVGPFAAARGVANMTAPTLTTPSATAASQSVLNIVVTTLEDRGGVYWVTTTNATAPTPAQVVAGKDASGSTATAFGALTNVTAGVRSTSASGLAASTTYYTHWCHEDWHGNRSSVVSASATTLAAVTGVRVLAQSGAASGFVTSFGQTCPAVAAGDVLIVTVEAIYTVNNCTLNTLPSGWVQLGGTGWDGAKRPPSVQGVSGKPSIWVFAYVAASSAGAQTFTFTLASGANVTTACHHIRADTVLSVAAYGGAVSASLPSVSLNAGDFALSIYSTFGTNAQPPTSAANATAFSVPDAPALPANSGVWIGQYLGINHNKWMALAKPVTTTGSYTSPAPADTASYCTFVIGLRPA